MPRRGRSCRHSQSRCSSATVASWRPRSGVTRGTKPLLGLDLRQDEDANAYFLVGPQTFTVVELPLRFRDDSFELVRVSDLDQDRNLELWWARSFNRCQNDPSDLERDLDCTARSADMGELQGNVLSYFVKSPRRDPARVAGTALTLNARIRLRRPAKNRHATPCWWVRCWAAG